MVCGLHRRRRAVRDRARCLGQAGERFDEEATEERESPEDDDGPDEGEREAPRPVAHVAEEETAPEAPGVGHRQARAENAEPGEERTPAQGGLEEQLVFEEAEGKGERREARGGGPACRRQKWQGLREAAEPAQAVLPALLGYGAGGE